MKAPTISSCYISCPMSVSQQTLDSYVAYAKEHLGTNDVHYWKRGTPYSKEVTQTVISAVDAFIVILPDNEFKFGINSLPSGTRSELLYAISVKEEGLLNNKEIFIAYTNKADGAMFYSASYNKEGLIQGVSGSKYNFREYCSNFKTKTSQEVEREERIDPILLSHIADITGMTKDQVKAKAAWLLKRGGHSMVTEWLEKIGVRPKYNTEKRPLESFKMVILDLTPQKEEYDRRILLLRSH